MIFTSGDIFEFWGTTVFGGLGLPYFLSFYLQTSKVWLDFLMEFSDILASIVSNVDWLLVLGDFNIHVCCPDKLLVSEFLQIVDSFNLFQSGATHDKGHTLDLILSFGFTLQILQIDDSYFSDHKPIIFNTACERTSYWLLYMFT